MVKRNDTVQEGMCWQLHKEELSQGVCYLLNGFSRGRLKSKNQEGWSFRVEGSSYINSLSMTPVFSVLLQ